MTTTTTNEINNEKNTAILTDAEVRAWLQEAIQGELQGNGLEWLNVMVDAFIDDLDRVEEWDQENAADAESKIREASTAAMKAQWEQARELMKQARADLDPMIGASYGAAARSLEEQFDWSDEMLFAASLDRSSSDWARWTPSPTCLDSDPYYDGLWRVLEAWEDEGAQLTLDGDQLVVAEEEDGGEEVFPEDD